MAGKMSSKVTIDTAIKNFHLKVQNGPEYVCLLSSYARMSLYINILNVVMKFYKIFCLLSMLVISSGCVGHVMVH